MKHIVPLAIISLLFLAQPCASTSLSSEALSSTEAFLSQIDSKNYQAAYQDSSSYLKTYSPLLDWSAQIEQTKALLGDVKSRKLVSLRSRDSYPGLPDGHFLIVYYETQTEYKAKATEVTLLHLNSEHWQVCKYTMK